MPTSGTGLSKSSNHGCHRPSLASGFTLVEVLVVVTIIGIFVGIAMLSTDLVNIDRKMAQESRRLESLLQLASEDALLQSQDYGLRFFAGGYEFYLFDHGNQMWRPIENDRIFKVRELDRMTLELQVEGRDVVLDLEREVPTLENTEEAAAGAEDENADDEDEPLFPDPQVVIFSSGEFTPFELTILNEAEPFEPGIVLEVEFAGIVEETGDDEQ